LIQKHAATEQPRRDGYIVRDNPVIRRALAMLVPPLPILPLIFFTQAVVLAISMMIRLSQLANGKARNSGFELDRIVP